MPGEAPRRPLRLFAKPEPIDVMAQVPDGPPLRFRWRRVLHAVARAEGPERIAMEWWRNQSRKPTRDYFRVEDEDGRRFWLYRDGLYGRETVRAALVSARAVRMSVPMPKSRSRQFLVPARRVASARN